LTLARDRLQFAFDDRRTILQLFFASDATIYGATIYNKFPSGVCERFTATVQVWFGPSDILFYSLSASDIDDEIDDQDGRSLQ
jgi:hypothetical protein